MRCPVTISNSRRMSSRSRKQYRNTVIAPMSMACVPSQTRCELMRVSSFSITRIHCARGGISSPSNFSTARTVAEVVGHGAEIVDAVGHRHDLLIELRLAGLLDAGVQIPDVGHDAHDGLAVDLQQQAQARRGSTGAAAPCSGSSCDLGRIQYRRRCQWAIVFSLEASGNPRPDNPCAADGLPSPPAS